MIKFCKYLATTFLIGIMLATLPGCEKGPAEKAGAAIDIAVEKTGQQLDKTGDKINNALKDTKK